MARSHGDRGPSFGGIVAPDFSLNGPRSHDIRSRSRDDRATIARQTWFFVPLDPLSDEDLMVAHDHASDEDWTLWKPPHVVGYVPKS